MTDRRIEFQDFFNRFSGKPDDTEAVAFIKHWRTDFIGFSNMHDKRTGETLLHVAVEKGFAGAARDIIDGWRRTGVGLNEVDHKGRTALHVAAQKGNADMCAMLLEYRGVTGFDVDHVDKSGRVPVQYALEELEGRDRIRTVKLFVENGIDLAKTSARIRDVAEKKQAERAAVQTNARTQNAVKHAGGFRIFI